MMNTYFKNMRKILSVTLTCVCVLTVVGCGSQGTNIAEGMKQIQELNYQEALDSFALAAEQEENGKLLYRGQGIAYLGMTRYEEAIESFLKALEYSDGWVEEVDYDINLYLASAYTKAGAYVEAETVYDAILALRPEDEQALFLRGNVRMKQGDYTNAKADFDETVRLDGKNFDRLIEIYEILNNYGYKDAGQGYLTDALQTYEDVMSMYDKGRMYFYMGDYSKAYQTLEEAKSQTGIEAYLYLGKAYEATGDYNYASSVYNSYLAKNTGDGRIYNQLGICEMQKGQYAKALDAFQKGLKIGDKAMQQSLQFNEIAAYEHMGEFKKAAVLMETYLKTYPDDEKAQREYEFLKTR